MGGKAAPAQTDLIRALRDCHPDVKKAVATALAGLGEVVLPAMIDLLSGPDYEQRSGAAAVLRQMGPLARSAGPALLKALFDNDRAADLDLQQAVAAQGRVVVPVLIEKLRSGSYADRSLAALVLGRMGPEAIDALPELERAGRDPRMPASNPALESHRKLRIHSKPLVQILADLKNDDPAIRTEALRDIAVLGPQAKEAVPVLLNLLQQPGIPTLVPEALRSIGPDAFVPLTDLLKSDDRTRVAMVIHSISTTDLVADRALPLLMPLLKNAPREGRLGALRLLAALGPKAEPAIPEAKLLLSFQDRGLSQAVVEFLTATRSPEAVALLADELRNPDPNSRESALRGLERIHTRKTPVLAAESALRDAVAVSDASMRQRLDLLLGKIEATKTSGDLDPLAQAVADLEDPNPEIRRAAIDDLAAMGPAASPATAALFRVARTTRGDLSNVAVSALLAIGPAAVPEISTSILQGTPDVQATQKAVDILCRMAPPATEALKALCEGLSRRIVFPDRTLEAGLRRLAPQAVPLLVELLEHGSPPGREAAAKLLCALGDLARDAFPALERAEEDPALAKVAPTIRAALRSASTIAADLRHEDSAKRIQAAQALASLGPRAKEMAPALVEAILSGKAEGQVFGPVRNALQRIGSPAFVPILKMFQDPRVREPHIVATLLEPIEAPPEAFPVLGELLKKRPLEVERMPTLLGILQRLGPQAQGLVYDATPLLQSGNASLVRGAIDFLAATGSNDAVRPLADLLKHADWQLRLQALAGLWTLKERGADLRPGEKELRESLADPQLKPLAGKILESLEAKKKLH